VIPLVQHFINLSIKVNITIIPDRSKPNRGAITCGWASAVVAGSGVEAGVVVELVVDEMHEEASQSGRK